MKKTKNSREKRDKGKEREDLRKRENEKRRDEGKERKREGFPKTERSREEETKVQRERKRERPFFPLLLSLSPSSLLRVVALHPCLHSSDELPNVMAHQTRCSRAQSDLVLLSTASFLLFAIPRAQADPSSVYCLLPSLLFSIPRPQFYLLLMSTVSFSFSYSLSFLWDSLLPTCHFRKTVYTY